MQWKLTFGKYVFEGGMEQATATVLFTHRAWATTKRQEARLEVNEMRMQRWMRGVTRRDMIWSEHNRGTTRVVQASKKITGKRLKWYGHVRRMKEKHIVRKMLDVDIPGKRRRGRPNLRWKDVRKIWQRRGQKFRGQRNKQGSMEEEDHQQYRRPQMTGQARDEEEDSPCPG